MTPKIIELIIQDGDEEAGLDGIALVEMPAHEANFEYFNQEETPCEDGKCSHYVLAEEQIPLALQMFQSFGQPQGELEMEGWEITKVKTLGKHEFAIISNPNLPSQDEDTPNRRYRYKYVGPQDERNRPFCAEMMKARRIFRREDIDTMSSMNINEVGPPGYSIFEWRGSYNCRHKWVQLTYEPVGRIINNSNLNTGVIDQEEVSGPDTRNTATKSLGTTGRKKGPDGWGTGDKGTAQQISRDRAPRDSGLFAASNPDVSALSPYVEQIKKPKKKPLLASLPLFENKEDAEAMALLMDCEGSHPHKYGDKTLWMPCKEHPKDETSYEVDNTDNTDNVGGSNNPMDNYAGEKISIDYDDTLSTDRGFKTAQDLIKGGAELYIISARKDKEGMLKTATELGIPSSRVFATGSNKAKVEKVFELGIKKHLDNNEDVIKQLGKIGEKFSDFGLEDACWDGYEPIGTKIADDGREVPNCVPMEAAMEMMKQEFQSYNDYPDSAKNNACKAIKWKEQHGDEVKGMTQVGWIRANQLCKGEKISEETISRMSGFQRHKRNSEVSPEFKDTPWKDNGYVAWLGWGGTTGINWASDKLKSIRNEMSFSVFSMEEKMVVGPAMVPDKMIIRRNEITGEIYYVYFTAETIKKLQQKFMLEKLLDKTNVEHGRKFLNGVSVVESWIVDDPEHDKQQVFGMDYPKGTWMVSMKIDDDAIWQKVKEGKLNGFSVQGYFLEKAKFNTDTHKILDEIKDILKQTV